jgi:threonine/homoserine/homoserine lactone efflux protein
MNAETLGLLIIACLAVNLSPGPSVLLVTTISAARGFKAGIFAVLGMNAGAFVHVILAASGVAALLATSPLVFSIIQYLGAGYLIYLGIDLLRSKPARPEPTTDSTIHSSACAGYTSAWKYFRRGLLVDSLNPKIALFFLAFIPQFLSATETPGFLVSVALGSVFLVTGTIVNGSIAYLAALGARRADGRGTPADSSRGVDLSGATAAVAKSLAPISLPFT